MRRTAHIIQIISFGKAVGLEPITDKWLKLGRNFKFLAKQIFATFKGHLNPTPQLNRARMMLLSKKKHTNAPPIGKIRPIRIYNPLRKAFESTIDYLDSELIWASIWGHQAGARPKQKMWK
jgi:hypothetical protein